MKENCPHIYLYKRIVLSKLFIDAHFHESIDLDNIAEEACFSKFHFIRLFKSIYGNTPHRYLIKVRMDRAEILLQKDMTVTDTCYEVGFESPASFTACFLKYKKISPSLYQKHYRERQRQIANAPLGFVPNCFVEQHGWSQKSNFEEVLP